MKRLIPLFALLFAVGYLGSALVRSGPKSAYDLNGFSRLPVLVNGRIKPVDTVARNTLLLLQNRQTVYLEDGSQLTPIEWLLDAVFRPEKADTYRTFAIDNIDLLNLLGKTESSLRIRYDNPVMKVLAICEFVPSRYRRFPFSEIAPHLDELERQAKLAEPVDAQLRTPFQKAAIALASNVTLYQRIKYSLVNPESSDFLGELLRFQQNLPEEAAALRARQAGQPHDEAAANRVLDLATRFDFMAKVGYLLAIPPATDDSNPDHWHTAGDALLDTFKTGSVNPEALTYAGLAQTWRAQRPEDFNKIVELYRTELAHRFAPQLTKSDVEARFNAAEPFYVGMMLFIFAFVAGVLSWLKWPDAMRQSAFYFVLVAWVATTGGLLTRMWLEGRPPVTNLYSSALYIGWGVSLLCLILESLYKNAIASVAAGVIGFCTLFIAHHLAMNGDTLEMMRAVLDSNFWLATHVIVVTTGYAATFLAGFLALIYILRGVFTRSLDRATADSLNRMVYGIVCFATLASLVGTILGGIWADQSWGRFWGWDPKENGALIIVLWNAIFLHARWGGLAKQRGLMALAVFGNVVTSWSWFGVNMLGVGLHSYGFMDAAFYWLVAFVVSQLGVIALAQLPLNRWKSFAPAPASASSREPAAASAR